MRPRAGLGSATTGRARRVAQLGASRSIRTAPALVTSPIASIRADQRTPQATAKTHPDHPAVSPDGGAPQASSRSADTAPRFAQRRMSREDRAGLRRRVAALSLRKLTRLGEPSKASGNRVALEPQRLRNVTRGRARIGGHEFDYTRSDVGAPWAGTLRGGLTRPPALTAATAGRRRGHPVQCIKDASQVARFSRERPQFLQPSIDIRSDSVE